jgi:hypothetical protein
MFFNTENRVRHEASRRLELNRSAWSHSKSRAPYWRRPLNLARRGGASTSARVACELERLRCRVLQRSDAACA